MWKKLSIPGVRWNSRTKRLKVEVIVPGPHAKGRGSVRRRATLPCESLMDVAGVVAEFRGRVLEAERAKPADEASGEITYGGYVAKVFPSREHAVKPKTWESYTFITTHFLLPHFADMRIQDITTPVVRDLFGELRQRELAAPTINRVLSILRLQIRDAYDRGLIKVMPVRGRLPHIQEPLLRLELSSEERFRFLSSFDNETAFRRHLERHRSAGTVSASTRFKSGPRRFGGGPRPDGRAALVLFERHRFLKPLFVVALETGLRKSDLLALRWSDIDFSSGWVRIVTRKTGEFVTIPMSDACRSALLDCRHRSVHPDLVFVDEAALPLGVQRIFGAFSLAKRLAGIERRFRFHDLRHTFGSTLASGGVSLQVIAKAMGHASIKQTERYARPSDEALLEIRRALDGGRKKDAPRREPGGGWIPEVSCETKRRVLPPTP